MQLERKRTVITGAATGIGRATALSFALNGAEIVIADINDEGGNETVSDLRDLGAKATYQRCDVSDGSAMQSLMNTAAEAMGGIDVIVNNAGLQRSGAVTEFAESEWDALMRTNPRSCFLGAKFGVPHLRDSGGGSITNVASLAGLKGGPGMTAYSASKGAIIAFSKALAEEVAGDGIRVNSVCPGWIDTPFNSPAIDFMGGKDEQAEMINQSVPLGRQGVPEEIAAAIVFLSSENSSYMTGQALVVDGGLL